MDVISKKFYDEIFYNPSFKGRIDVIPRNEILIVRSLYHAMFSSVQLEILVGFAVSSNFNFFVRSNKETVEFVIYK